LQAVLSNSAYGCSPPRRTKPIVSLQHQAKPLLNFGDHGQADWYVFLLGLELKDHVLKLGVETLLQILGAIIAAAHIEQYWDSSHRFNDFLALSGNRKLPLVVFVDQH